MLRFDVVAHGRVVGALKVPLSKAPVGAIQDEGEKSLVDARFSAAQIQETGLTPAQLARRPPRKQLGSVRVKVVARMGKASKVKKDAAVRRWEPSSSPSIYLLQKTTKTRWKGGSRVRQPLL